MRNLQWTRSGQALLVLVTILGASVLWADEKEKEPAADPAALLEEARTRARQGDFTGAMLLSQQAVAAKADVDALSLHASLCERSGHHQGAIEALTQWLAQKPEEDFLYHRRGVAKFMHGDFKGAVADFDVYLEKVPEKMPSHWQRGLAHYGAALFREGRAQFEAHQKVNRHDVENAAWHFLCVARLEGVDGARKALIPIQGDTRVPMKEIHDLFAGKGTKEDVLKAAGTESPSKRDHLCYAHLYLALYEEALGNDAAALKHYRLAAEDYQMPHYMGRTAQVFYQSRRAKD